MPCTYYTPEEERQMAYAEREKMRKELDRATKILCEASKKIERLQKSGVNTHMDPEWAQWWAEHKLMDAERIKEEKAKEKAAAKRKKTEEEENAKLAAIKSKLTKEELALLKRKG